jgi:hypothetical protein
MAWTTPPTLTDGQVLTGAHTQIWRDDLNLTMPALASASGQHFVATGANATAARLSVAQNITVSEATTNTSYAALTTAGPAVTVTCGPFVLVGMSAKLTHNTATASGFMSYAISGASTTSATDNVSITRQFSATTESLRCSSVLIQVGMTGGSNIFTALYRTSAGSAGFDSRHLFAIPF